MTTVIAVGRCAGTINRTIFTAALEFPGIWPFLTWHARCICTGQPRRITGVLYQAGAGIVHSGVLLHDPSAAFVSLEVPMTERRRWSVPLVLALTASLAASCASLGTPSIAEVHGNPGRYAGTVTTSWGVPLVPYRMYRVSDGQAEILVLSDGRRTPSKGARVRVRGEVEEFAVLGGRSFGLHLREKSLKVL
jgi:hypothetical protein